MRAVEFKNITKNFGSFAANDDITFSIEQNSVHCILGENGAGKSTLMKILFGMYKPDKGSMKVFGEDVEFGSPHDAIAKRIGMVHQHFMLIDDFTVLENVILGDEITKGISIDFTETKKILNSLIGKFNLDLDADKKVSELNISHQQKVEILKLLYRKSDILIFDEPTAVLSPIEVEKFFEIVNEFKNEGKTIILITHKLNEVKQISDRVTVLRRGKVVHEEDNTEKKLNIEQLSKAIVGDVNLVKVTSKTYEDKQSEVLLELSNVNLKRGSIKILNDLNLKLFRGEIHGICGVEGNGQNEIVDIIAGLEENFEGKLHISANGISIVPDDRIKKGMIKEYSIGENIILRKKEGKLVSKRMLHNISDEITRNYDVRAGSLRSELGSLSGGNQQKVIVAREIELGNDIMIFSHPTRGVDINATLFIHSKIIEQRNEGKAILLISSDLDELVSLSDKLSVIYNGKIVKTFEYGELKAAQMSEELLEINTGSDKSLYDKIGKLMIGYGN